MATSAQAKRYAQAVFEIAEQSGEFDRWLADLRTLADLAEAGAFLDALETPNLTFEQKGALLRVRYPEISGLAVNLANLLVQRRRIRLLPAIYDEYGRLLDQYRGIERAEVTTAVELSQDERELLERRLSAITGRKMVLTARVDPSIIGGIVARFGGKLLDGSTRSRLEALKKEISQVPR